MIDLATIGATLRRLRTEQGLSIRELAARVECSYQQISAIENADVHNPSVRMLERIASALGVGVEVRVVGTEAVPRDDRPIDPELQKMLRDLAELWPTLLVRERRTLKAMLESLRSNG